MPAGALIAQTIAELQPPEACIRTAQQCYLWTMRIELIVVAAAALAVAGCSRPQAGPAPTGGPGATSVNFFIPGTPAGQAQDGSCFTRSIAIPRPGAWRCMVGNQIFDPCFATPSGSGTLVCGADPALGKDGFPLKLTKPLPTDLGNAPEQPPAWVFELSDGSVCEPFTGTMPMVGGEPARWSCFVPSSNGGKQVTQRGLVTKLNRGKLWTAERYAESQVGGPETANRRVEAARVPVVRVWE
jgi:hypothetical protein